MIVIANEDFATGMMLAGVPDCHKINEKHEAEEVLKGIDMKEFIIATQDIVEMVPDLLEYPNLAVFPSQIKDFSNIDDLKQVIKKAIGAEVNI